MTPQEYVDAVAALKVQPGNLALQNTVNNALRDNPALGDARANDIARYYRNNTVMDAWPQTFIYPVDEADLMNKLEVQKHVVTSFRAFGDGYGFANANITAGCSVRLTSMDKGLQLEDENFRDAVVDANDWNPDDYVRVQGGITFEKLNALLANTGRTVIQQPGFNKLTVAGCSAAGGHGSGIELYGIAGYVQAIELVNFDAHKNVRVMRVEPKNGLTDPAKYAAAHPGGKHVLVQDDVLFHSARCAQGHLGVVSALTFKVTKQYVLQEDRTFMDWNSAWASLPAMFADPKTHSVHVWINPYTTNGSTNNPNVLVTHLTRTNQPPWGIRGIGILFGGPNVITDFANVFLGQDFAPAIDAALKTCQSTGVRMPSTQALDFGPPNGLPVYAASLGFDATRGDEVVKRLIPELAGLRVKGFLVTSPIGMRWVKGSQDFLSPQYGRDTIMLEMPILRARFGKDDPKGKQTLDQYANWMMDNFDARPHWGQQNPMTRKQFENNYGSAAIGSFVTALETFDPLNMFDGPLSKQIGLRDIAAGR
ncbi:MAG: D-arabinono-1,4-lactone oxidase [Archangium sp.]